MTRSQPFASLLPVLVTVSLASMLIVRSAPAQSSDSSADSSTTASTTMSDADTTVTASVRGLRNYDGQLLVALYDRAEPFPGNDDAAVDRTALSLDARGEEDEPLSVTFHDVPDGTYAFAIIHDENGNGELDTNFFGLPTEGYGFSNGAEPGTFGPPDFEEAAITINGSTTEPIEVQY